MTNLRFSAWLCQRIVTEARDAIIFADTENVIRLWNRGAVEIFGYSAEETLGKPLDLIIPESLRERHHQGYQRVMATGQTKYAREILAVPAVRQDKTRISLEFTIILIKDDNSVMLGAAAIIREVTARWKLDRERQQRLADLETKLASLTTSKG
jgi:PAS domain S-box-containing protein|uniref:histidine kinase n=1 Tax=Desulfobacca acetoxidans TaxID=60893 RepID=A0A7V6A160_9BACT